VEDVSIASGRSPEVDRLNGSTTVLLTIRGTRGEKVRDRDTRVKVRTYGDPLARSLDRLDMQPNYRRLAMVTEVSRVAACAGIQNRVWAYCRSRELRA
jgi:hypothetical protein